MFRRLLPVILSACVLAGCGGRHPPLESTPDLTVTKDVGLPAPDRRDLVAPDRVSLIGPLDTLGIDVFNAQDFSREVVVDASGRIAMPLIGTIDANGKTATELASEITGLLKGRYIRDPDVTVNIKESVSQVVTVDGSVNKPGLYPVTNQSTLLRAVAASGGLGDYAKINDVVILRTVNGKRMAGLYNIGAIRRGIYVDPPVYANDVIVVGDSPARRMFRDALAVAPLLVAPLVAILN
nr:polysaccharide biosynthesis/export family protein [Sphingomonas jinjuensis]